MNVSYEVRDNYLYVKALGEVNSPSARDILFEKARNHSLNRVLCDITGVTGFDTQQTSAMARFSTGEIVAESIPRDFRLVVLETSQQFTGGQGQFSENVMVNRGTTVKVTTSLSEALEWLGVGPWRRGRLRAPAKRSTLLSSWFRQSGWAGSRRRGTQTVNPLLAKER